MRPQIMLIIASTFGALAVLIGAFGAHALKTILEQNERIPTFETASKYHFYHTIVMVIIGVIALNNQSKYLAYSSWSFMFGILFFSGSLYILSLTNYKFLGAVAPIGGLLLLAGWILLLLHFFQSASN